MWPRPGVQGAVAKDLARCRAAGHPLTAKDYVLSLKSLQLDDSYHRNRTLSEFRGPAVRPSNLPFAGHRLDDGHLPPCRVSVRSCYRRRIPTRRSRS
jgi:hypothetical protein